MDYTSYEQAFKGKREWLVDNTEVSIRLLNKLYDADVLVTSHCREIKACPTDEKKSNELYDILSRRDFGSFTSFCTALNETGQSHVARYLTSPAPKKPDTAAKQLKLTDSADVDVEMKPSSPVATDGADADSLKSPSKMTSNWLAVEEVFHSQRLYRLKDLIEPDYGFPRCLHYKGVISNGNLEQIIQEPKFCDRIANLLAILRKNLQNPLIHEAWRETRQSHVSNYVRFEGFHLDECNDDWPLDVQQQRLLSHPILCRGLNLWNGFLDELVAVDCISEEQRNTVASLNEDMCYDRFIQILKRRSVADYKRFFRCVESTQPEKIVDVFKSAGALALIKSTVIFRSDEETDKIEQTVIELFNLAYFEGALESGGNRTFDDYHTTARDWANSLLNAIGLSYVSFLERTNSIYWYFNCTHTGAVQRLREAHDYGVLRNCLEDVVTRLSGCQDRVNLRVEWDDDDYMSCLEYVRKSPVGGVFALISVDTLPYEILEVILIRTALLLVKHGECPHPKEGVFPSLSHDKDVCAVQTVNAVCMNWWNILTGRWWNPVDGPSRNGRVIRRTLDVIGRHCSKIWMCRGYLQNKIEVKFGLLAESAKRRVLTSTQYKTIVSAVHEDSNLGRKADFGEELDTVNESTKQLLLRTKKLPFAMYRQFKKALSSCHQQHLVNAINSGFKYDRSKHGSCWPLNEDVLKRIVIHHRDLIDLIDTRRGLVDDMLAVHCISQSHAQYIKSASNCQLQNRRLLEVLCRRSQADFDAAVACLCRKQSFLGPLFQQTAVVAKLIAKCPVLEQDEHQLWLLSERPDERYSSLGQPGKGLHLIGVGQTIGRWVFYILCLRVDAVLNLAAFSADGSSTSLFSDVVTDIIRRKAVEIQSLSWPVVDYNRCLHVFYSCMGSFTRIYDFYGFLGHRLLVSDQTACIGLGSECESQTFGKCSDHVLEAVLQKAAGVLFKRLMKLTSQADIGAICVVRMVCRRWSKVLIDIRCVRRHMDETCQPYRRRLLPDKTLKEQTAAFPSPSKIQRWSCKMEKAVCDWAVPDVVQFLEKNGLESHAQNFIENEVDGATLLGLTDLMISRLLPTMKLQVKFNDLLRGLKLPVALPAETDGQPELMPTTSLAVRSCQAVSMSYRLPTFPDDVKNCLAARHADKFKIGSKMRSLVVDAIHNDLIAKGILYPSRLVYSNVCSALMLHYPFLSDYDGTLNSMQFALRQKFERTRQPLVQDGAIAEMRSKYGRPGVSGRKRASTEVCAESGGNDSEAPVVQKVARFKENSLDEVLAGEDERSIAKHIGFMKAEMRKHTPDLNLVADCMKRTAAFRQKFCHQNTTKDVLDKFPCLQLKLLFVADAKLLYDLDMNRLGQSLLLITCRVIKEASGRCVEFAAVMDDYNRRVEDASDDKKKELDIELCLRLLPTLFAEQHTLVRVTAAEDVKNAAPCIVGSNQYNVVVDGSNILKAPTSSFEKVAEVWFAAFWLLSIEYPPKIAKTCQFIEKVLLQKGGKPSAAVRKWGNRLLG